MSQWLPEKTDVQILEMLRAGTTALDKRLLEMLERYDLFQRAIDAAVVLADAQSASGEAGGLWIDSSWDPVEDAQDLLSELDAIEERKR